MFYALHCLKLGLIVHTFFSLFSQVSLFLRLGFILNKGFGILLELDETNDKGEKKLQTIQTEYHNDINQCAKPYKFQIFY